MISLASSIFSVSHFGLELAVYYVSMVDPCYMCDGPIHRFLLTSSPRSG